ncbi:dihydrolipoamide acetyltransferase family protein [Chloroflexota bacterium]
MAVEVKIPQLGKSLQKPVLVEWKVKEGDWVEQGGSVLVIETEKIRNDIEAEASGYVHILVEEGNEAGVSSVVAYITETKEELAALQKEKPAVALATVVETEEAPPAETEKAEAAPPAKARAEESGRIRISPVARKLAEEHLIDITTLSGTGPGGRIIREDVEKAIQRKAAAPSAAPTAEVHEGLRVKEAIPLSGMRGAIAEHVHRSLAISAQVTIMGEIDMAQTVKLRNDLVAQETFIGSKITYTSIFVLTAVKALKEYPIVNSSIIDNDIKVWEDINIGVAVALEHGLTVPVLKQADKKTLGEIDQEIKEMTERARSGRLGAEDLAGGTFTVSNIGAVGVGYRFSTVIINQPQSAILGMGSITDRPQVREGQIVIRPIMTYSFTYDHRVMDGTVAARFMASVIRFLENPNLLLV